MRLITCWAAIMLFTSLPASAGSAIFLHPDGAGLNQWNTLRAWKYGPDAESHWDKLPQMAVYLGHMNDGITATSNGGATAHAYGQTASIKDFGRKHNDTSIIQSARSRGKAIALIQSGHIAEPGTAAFVAFSDDRENKEAIAQQVIESGAEIIMAGGERYLLPKGTHGRHGEGTRTDGRNLIEEATTKGYQVVYTKEELASVNPATTTKLLGIFASNHSFFDETEETLTQQKLPLYLVSAPTLAEMLDAALTIFTAQSKEFLAIVEEEGSDNFGNKNNALGVLTALSRADDAIAVARAAIAKNPAIHLIMAADSDAGGMQMQGISSQKPLPATDKNGAPVDGIAGSASSPFITKPDQHGISHPFSIRWASMGDVSGAVLVRAEGRAFTQLPTRLANHEIKHWLEKALDAE